MFSGSIRIPLAVIVTALVTSTCDKVPLLAPTGSSITVSAPTNVLPLGGSTEIQAFVLESGNTPVHNGTSVRFFASLGTLSPPEAQTRNGVATTTFIGTTSGTAQIRAASGGAGSGTTPDPDPDPDEPAANSGSNVVTIAVGAAAAADGGVTVQASPSSVPPGGGTVTITAFAVDTNGNRMVGVPVSFSSTTGSLSSSVATTDGNGEARVELTAGAESVVTARVGSRTATVTVTVATATSVELAVSANPIEDRPMTLTITPAEGTTPRVTIDWGDGSSQDIGTVAAVRSVAHTYGDDQTFAITVTATGIRGDTFTTSIIVVVAPPPVVTNVSPDGKACLRNVRWIDTACDASAAMRWPPCSSG